MKAISALPNSRGMPDCICKPTIEPVRSPPSRKAKSTTPAGCSCPEKATIRPSNSLTAEKLETKWLDTQNLHATGQSRKRSAERHAQQYWFVYRHAAVKRKPRSSGIGAEFHACCCA